jgi:hypothetical protein
VTALHSEAVALSKNLGQKKWASASQGIAAVPFTLAFPRRDTAWKKREPALLFSRMYGVWEVQK